MTLFAKEHIAMAAHETGHGLAGKLLQNRSFDIHLGADHRNTMFSIGKAPVTFHGLLPVGGWSAGQQKIEDLLTEKEIENIDATANKHYRTYYNKTISPQFSKDIETAFENLEEEEKIRINNLQEEDKKQKMLQIRGKVFEEKYLDQLDQYKKQETNKLLLNEITRKRASLDYKLKRSAVLLAGPAFEASSRFAMNLFCTHPKTLKERGLKNVAKMALCDTSIYTQLITNLFPVRTNDGAQLLDTMIPGAKSVTTNGYYAEIADAIRQLSSFFAFYLLKKYIQKHGKEIFGETFNAQRFLLKEYIKICHLNAMLLTHKVICFIVHPIRGKPSFNFTIADAFAAIGLFKYYIPLLKAEYSR